MSKRLHCYSFHSVKGGVGKSTLATRLACGLADELATTLIDMDLTGTSLADVLPLQAPRWSQGMSLTREPDSGVFEREQSREMIRARGDAAGSELQEPPFLNDFLLYAAPDWSADNEVDARALRWRMQGQSKECLHVIPSSALPRDLERIMPVIFDEEHAAFLEGRLEFLLDGLIRNGADEQAVVFDTPPTIPGLSRTVLSLALRLGGPEKVALADDDYIPDVLRETEISWRIFLVVTMDMQDLRAANRWLERLKPEEETLFRVIVNRVDQNIPRERVGAEIDACLTGANPLAQQVTDSPYIDPLSGDRMGILARPLGDSLLTMSRFPMIPVFDQPGMSFFRSEHGPQQMDSDDGQEFLDALREA